MPPALASVRADLGATLRQGGWLLSVISLMTAVGGMAIALTAERFGHRRLVLLGTAVCLVASLSGAFATDVAAATGAGAGVCTQAAAGLA
jgi:MFS transporter, DHA1 family, inner membrane transport protein